MSVDELENVSMPSSSQESNASFSSANNKRTLEPDIKEDDNGYMHQGIWHDTNPTISTYNTSSSTTISRRTILSPKLGQHRRRIVVSSPTHSPKTHNEQENANPLAATSMPYDSMDIDDFGEASFLRRREEVDFENM